MKTEQKKEYIVPEMDILEMEHNINLLTGSPDAIDGYNDLVG